MNPVCKLIVALDVPVDDAFHLARRLRYQANNFKLGVASFLTDHGFSLARFLVREGAGLMIDLKLYDTHDTVRRTMEIVNKLGAHWVTVHAACTKHAVGFGPKILSVQSLTDATGMFQTTESRMSDLDSADGIVCTARQAQWLRQHTDKLLVCPGIRPAGAESDNHVKPSTPGDAIRAGADYIVVGRPIIAAADPVEAARAIMREIEEAGTRQPGSPG